MELSELREKIYDYIEIGEILERELAFLPLEYRVEVFRFLLNRLEVQNFSRDVGESIRAMMMRLRAGPALDGAEP